MSPACPPRGSGAQRRAPPRDAHVTVTETEAWTAGPTARTGHSAGPRSHPPDSLRMTPPPGAPLLTDAPPSTDRGPCLPAGWSVPAWWPRWSRASPGGSSESPSCLTPAQAQCAPSVLLCVLRVGSAYASTLSLSPDSVNLSLLSFRPQEDPRENPRRPLGQQPHPQRGASGLMVASCPPNLGLARSFAGGLGNRAASVWLSLLCLGRCFQNRCFRKHAALQEGLRRSRSVRSPLWPSLVVPAVMLLPHGRCRVSGGQ